MAPPSHYLIFLAVMTPFAGWVELALDERGAWMPFRLPEIGPGESVQAYGIKALFTYLPLGTTEKSA